MDKKATMIGRVLSENEIMGFIHFDGLGEVVSGRVWSEDTEPHFRLSPVNRFARTLTRLIYSHWQTLVRPQPEIGPYSARFPVWVAVIWVSAPLWYWHLVATALSYLYLDLRYLYIIWLWTLQCVSSPLFVLAMYQAFGISAVVQMVPVFDFYLRIFILMLCIAPVSCTMSVQHVTNWEERVTLAEQRVQERDRGKGRERQGQSDE